MVPVESELFSRFGRQVDSGQVIFQEWEEGDQMFIIQEGRVKVSRRIGGKEQIMAVLGKGDFFGEMALVTRERRTATVSALEPVKLLAFNREGFVNMINKNPKIALNMIDRLCRRLAHANQHLRHLTGKDVQGLIAMNLRLAFQASGGGELDHERTVTDLSQNLELEAGQVRAIFEELACAGVLRIQGGIIAQADAEKLAGLGEPLGV